MATLEGVFKHINITPSFTNRPKISSKQSCSQTPTGEGLELRFLQQWHAAKRQPTFKSKFLHSIQMWHDVVKVADPNDWLE